MSLDSTRRRTPKSTARFSSGCSFLMVELDLCKAKLITSSLPLLRRCEFFFPNFESYLMGNSEYGVTRTMASFATCINVRLKLLRLRERDPSSLWRPRNQTQGSWVSCWWEIHHCRHQNFPMVCVTQFLGLHVLMSRSRVRRAKGLEIDLAKDFPKTHVRPSFFLSCA